MIIIESVGENWSRGGRNDQETENQFEYAESSDFFLSDRMWNLLSGK